MVALKRQLVEEKQRSESAEKRASAAISERDELAANLCEANKAKVTLQAECDRLTARLRATDKTSPSRRGGGASADPSTSSRRPNFKIAKVKSQKKALAAPVTASTAAPAPAPVPGATQGSSKQFNGKHSVQRHRTSTSVSTDASAGHGPQESTRNSLFPARLRVLELFFARHEPTRTQASMRRLLQEQGTTPIQLQTLFLRLEEQYREHPSQAYYRKAGGVGKRASVHTAAKEAAAARAAQGKASAAAAVGESPAAAAAHSLRVDLSNLHREHTRMHPYYNAKWKQQRKVQEEPPHRTVEEWPREEVSIARSLNLHYSTIAPRRDSGKPLASSQHRAN